MEKKNIVKGKLLRERPYKISQIGNSSVGVTLNYSSGLKKGDKVYQEILGDIILLVPEKIWKERESKK